MSQHPLNLALRFVLELALLFVFAVWAWQVFGSPLRQLMAVLLPLAGAVIWAVFKVDGDPGKALVPIPGWLRLLIEAGLVILAIVMLRDVGRQTAAIWLLAVTALHYLLSADRIRKLLGRDGTSGG